MTTALPGQDLIEAGLLDLRAGRETVEALLVAVGEPRLRRLGLELPEQLPSDPEHRLYELLAKEDSDAAHSRYNALIRRLVSFERAPENVNILNSTLMQEFIRSLASTATSRGSVYLVGGASAVILGWRESTIDVDLKFVPDSDEQLRALPKLKERLKMNIKLASPDHFIPELPAWQERSLFIQQQGSLAFFHYDFYAQALAKIERSHAVDLKDVEEMIRRGLVEPNQLDELFASIEGQLYRYPAVDAPSFRLAVERVLSRDRSSDKD